MRPDRAATAVQDVLLEAVGGLICALSSSTIYHCLCLDQLNHYLALTIINQAPQLRHITQCPLLCATLLHDICIHTKHQIIALHLLVQRDAATHTCLTLALLCRNAQYSHWVRRGLAV